MTRQSFSFYRSFRDAARHLEDADRLALYDALADYALDGIDPEDGGIVAALFELLRPVLDSQARRSEAGAKGAQYGSKGGRPSNNPYETPTKPLQNPYETPTKPLNKDKDKEIDKDKDKEGEGDIKDARARFTPPTVPEVTAYSQEIGAGIDAERFVDFYTANGWKVGRNPMKDWRAAFRNWAKKEKDERARSGTYSISDRVSIVDTW